MADIKKVSELDAITTTVSTDLMHVAQDAGGGSYVSKKITVGNLKSDVLSLDQTTPQTVDGGMPIFNAGIVCGGSTSGLSTLASGLVINNAQGGTDVDDFIVKTIGIADALTVDASADEIVSKADIYIRSDTKALHLGDSNDVSLKYDGTSMKVSTKDIAPSDIEIDCGTAKTLALTEVVWDDLKITPGAFDLPAQGNDPSLVAYDVGGGGISTYLWQFEVGNIACFVVQLPHTYKQGENLSVHIHWTPGPNGVAESGNYVGWKVQYSWANIDGVFGGMTTADLSDVCDGVDHKHQMTPSVSILGTDKRISSMLLCNVLRTDTGNDDTWAGTLSGARPMLLEIDFHFPIDTMGSRTIGVK